MTRTSTWTLHGNVAISAHFCIRIYRTGTSRVGYRNPVPIWHRYLCNRYVLEPNQNADFGASFRCHVLCFSKTHVRSITGYNYKYFSKMYILVRVIALLFHCAPSVWRAFGARSEWSLWRLAENRKAKAHALLTAKWKYFHGFLTFTDGEYTCEL